MNKKLLQQKISQYYKSRNIIGIDQICVNQSLDNGNKLSMDNIHVNKSTRYVETVD